MITSPYPYNYFSSRVTLRLAVIIFGVVSLFLFLFKPVGISNDIRYPLLVTCLIYGAIAGFTFYGFTRLFHQGIYKRIPTFNWTVIKEVLLFLGLVVTVGLVNFLVGYFLMTGNNGLTFERLLSELSNALLVSLIPLGVISVVNFLSLFTDDKEHQYVQQLIVKRNAILTNNDTVDTSILFEAKDTVESALIPLHQLAFVRADGNYVEFMLLGEGKPTEQLLRTPLKQVELKLAPYPNFVRTHRGYIVNMDFIESATGNTQGMELGISGTNWVVPVSRSFIPSVNAMLANV